MVRIVLNLHSSFREQGATSLGPAVLASVAVASRYPGSKVTKPSELSQSKNISSTVFKFLLRF